LRVSDYIACIDPRTGSSTFGWPVLGGSDLFERTLPTHRLVVCKIHKFDYLVEGEKAPVVPVVSLVEVRVERPLKCNRTMESRDT
jgi:hypothetical protein